MLFDWFGRLVLRRASWICCLDSWDLAFLCLPNTQSDLDAFQRAIDLVVLSLTGKADIALRQEDSSLLMRRRELSVSA